MEWHPSSVGGVQSHVRGLALWLSRRGFRVSVVSRRVGLTDLRLQESEGYYVVNSLLPLEAIFVPPDPRDIEDVISKLEPDVVHSHHIFTLTPLLALKVASDLGIPRVATNHTIFLAHDFRMFWSIASLILPTRYYLQYAQAIISVSRAADTFVESIMGSDLRARRFIVPNAVDTLRIRPPEREPEDNIILFVGRLVYRKGLHVLVKALQRIKGRDFKLYVVGGGYMEIPARMLAKAYGVEDKVEFLGVVPEDVKIELYRRAKIVVVPSILNESFGIVALEAMAAGRPVIASRVGGLEDIVVNGETGILVEPGSEEQLAEAIELLLDDEPYRRRLGANARRVVEERYSWDVVLDRIVDVYNYTLTLKG
jgi:glycosyltransferase involved in cell wall biosynthesis